MPYYFIVLEIMNTRSLLVLHNILIRIFIGISKGMCLEGFCQRLE